MWVVVVLEVGMAQISFEYWPVMMRMDCLPCFVIGDIPKISFATNSSDSDTWKRCYSRRWRYLGLLRAQHENVRTI